DKAPRRRIELDARHFRNKGQLALLGNGLRAFLRNILVFAQFLAEGLAGLPLHFFDGIRLAQWGARRSLGQMSEGQHGVPLFWLNRLRTIDTELDVLVHVSRPIRLTFRGRRPAYRGYVQLADRHLDLGNADSVLAEPSHRWTVAMLCDVNKDIRGPDLPR